MLLISDITSILPRQLNPYDKVEASYSRKILPLPTGCANACRSMIDIEDQQKTLEFLKETFLEFL